MTGDFTFFFKKRSIDTAANSVESFSSFYGVNPKNLLRQYRDYLSDSKNWEQKAHAKKWLLYPENLGDFDL